MSKTSFQLSFFLVTQKNVFAKCKNAHIKKRLKHHGSKASHFSVPY